MNQKHPLIPGVTIFHGTQEYEAARTDNNTKQLVEGNKKCPELMVHIFDQVLASHPSEQRNIQIHGCLLSKITCAPLMLSNPFGYVKLVSHGEQLMHPEVKDAFKPDMASLLEHF